RSRLRAYGFRASLKNFSGWSGVERSRQAGGKLHVSGFRNERSRFAGSSRSAILVFRERLTRQNDRFKIGGELFGRLGFARFGFKRFRFKRLGRSVLGRRQVAARPAVVSSASTLASKAAIAPAASATVAAIVKAARPAIAVLFERRPVLLNGGRSRRAGIGAGSCARRGTLQDFALEGNNCRRGGFPV